MPLTTADKRLALYGVAAGAGIALVATALRRREEPEVAVVTAPPVPLGPWADRIRDYANRVSSVTNWGSGFGNFLVATAWTESKGNPNACAAPCSENSARGWFQNRPVSARVWDFTGGGPHVLFSEPWAVALAAWYAVRTAMKNRDPGQVVDWLAMRRGWALPRLVDDVYETEPVTGYADGERSRDVRERFSQALAAVGLPQSFMYEPAFPPGFQWPGNYEDEASTIPILTAVGAPPAALAA